VTISNGDERTLPSVPPPLPRGQIFEPGEVLDGGYEIRSLLGEGGMGQVFEATDLGLNRLVAIKAAWPGTPQPSVRKEAQALAALRHPNLVTVYALGRHRDIEFLVMERIWGVSLFQHLHRKRVAKEPFSVDEAVAMLTSIVETLDVVHRAGVAHRDVKPANIMLAPRGRVVLMDFGIFRPERDVGSESSVTGTPEYLAPESIRGAVKPGAAYLTDLYAAGVIGFELLAGAAPFSSDTPQKTLLMHIEQPVPDLARRRPDAPPALTRIVCDLLAKNPDERPQADEVLWRLRTLEKQQPARDYSIVIVDDHADMLDLLALKAAEAAPGARVQSARSGADALTLVQRAEPDLVIADLDMPDMNGLELCMYLRGTQAASHAEIVVVSGKARTADLQLLRTLGVGTFVPKRAGFLQQFSSVVRDRYQARRTRTLR
jgi:serine/threonine-protein kinase